MTPDRNPFGKPAGLTIVELLVTVVLASLLFLMGFTGFQWFQNNAQTTQAIRTVTSAFSTARYRAIQENRSVKCCLESGRLVLKKKENNRWLPFSHTKLAEELEVTMNASPVFLPTGFVSPLCSVFIKDKKHRHKITLSIAGRIKVTKIK